MARNRKTYDDDDGRVIANMNVDGMPWYMRDQRKKQSMSTNSDFSNLSKEETRAIIWGTIKAGLLIAGIFVVAALIFILFCVFVWFK